MSKSLFGIEKPIATSSLQQMSHSCGLLSTWARARQCSALDRSQSKTCRSPCNLEKTPGQAWQLEIKANMLHGAQPIVAAHVVPQNQPQAIASVSPLILLISASWRWPEGPFADLLS